MLWVFGLLLFLYFLYILVSCVGIRYKYCGWFLVLYLMYWMFGFLFVFLFNGLVFFVLLNFFFLLFFLKYGLYFLLMGLYLGVGFWFLVLESFCLVFIYVY